MAIQQIQRIFKESLTKRVFTNGEVYAIIISKADGFYSEPVFYFLLKTGYQR